MAYTRQQAQQVYNAKIRSLMLKNARIEQEQDDEDRAALMKQQQDWDKATGIASLLNVGKDIRESIIMGKMRQKYGDPENIAGVLQRGKRYDYKHDAGLLERTFAPLEETEGYKQFKAKEERGEYIEETFESPEFLAQKEAFKEQALKDLDNIKLIEQGRLTEAEVLEKAEQGLRFNPMTDQWEAITEVDPLELQKAQEQLANIESRAWNEEQSANALDTLRKEAGDFDYKNVVLGDESALKLYLADIENAKFNQYDLTKTRAQELSNILEREGVVIPPGMTEEKTLELLSSFDKVPKGKYPVGALAKDQPEYRAFVDTLKSGSQNPATFQSVVTDLTENTDQTIQSAIDGTYVPEVEDVSTAVETTGLGEIEEWQRDLGIEEPGVFTAEELENMPASTALTLPTPAPEGLGQYGLTPQQKAIQELERKAMPSGVSMQELEGKLPSIRPLSFREGTLPKTVTAEPRVPEGARRISEFDPMGDVDLDVSPELEGAPPIVGISPQKGDIGLAPPTVPDAKPDGKFIGKTLGALQTGQQMLNIGKTLTNEEASGADKALAGTQGVKMLADMAAKKAGQKTAVEAVRAGTKIGGKAAVGAAAGGVIGGYTAVTEAKEAGEAWEEKDYDEAILHGMGSASGMFQTAGAGMMLSGVGAPLGAVIYGIGTAGSAISSVGLMLEGLFGDAPAEVQKPKFNYSRYFESIRRR